MDSKDGVKGMDSPRVRAVIGAILGIAGLVLLSFFGG
jgi:hypothetical protein